MTRTEDLDSVTRLYATLDTSALLALLPLIDSLSERVRQEIERIGEPLTSVAESQQAAAVFESVTAGLTALANQWPGSDAFQEIQAQVDADKAKLQARTQPARAVEVEALDRAFVYSINLHQRRQLAVFELERRGVLPTWFSA